MAILEKIYQALRFVAHGIFVAVKAVGKFIVWLFKFLYSLISALITWMREALSPRAQVILIAVIAALLIVGVAFVVTGHGCSAEPKEEEPPPPPEVVYTPNEIDLQNMSYQPGTISSFSLVSDGNQMYAQLSEEDNQAITDAIAYFENKKEEVGFIILNLNTGSGYCYDVDTKVYGASTYKAPISAYICESWVDANDNSLVKVKDRIEESIVWSDNNSYRSLKHGFTDATHDTWLSEMGINPSSYQVTFPTYSVRDSATIWMHIYEYLKSGSETANWLKSLFHKTEVSFLRDGVAQAGVSGASVYNKAGWCASDNGREDSVCDAGIVVDGDQEYLVVAFSSIRDSEPAEAALTDLFTALIKARKSLDPSAATWENTVVPSDPSNADDNNDAQQ